jgi:hypothetical protein
VDLRFHHAAAAKFSDCTFPYFERDFAKDRQEMSGNVMAGAGKFAAHITLVRHRAKDVDVWTARIGEEAFGSRLPRRSGHSSSGRRLRFA